jgi:hypothetical protein
MRKVVVQMSWNPAAAELAVENVRTGMSALLVPARGAWPEAVQVLGNALDRFLARLPRDEDIQLIAMPSDLCVVTATTRVTLQRHDAVGRRPVRKKLQQSSPFAETDDAAPSGRWERNAMWSFSARVPFPQHRRPRDP